MEPYLGLLGLVAITFASTNMDNLVLLVGWQVSGAVPASRLFAGYCVGMFGILLLSVGLGLVGYLFPLEYLGLLGVIPVAVGLKLFIAEWRGRKDAQPVTLAGGSILTVAATQLSNGVDTVLVFAPLLADSLLRFDAAIVSLFLLMIFLWYWLAKVLGNQMGRLAAVEKLGRWLAPLVMMAVGLYILINTATDLTPQ